MCHVANHNLAQIVHNVRYAQSILLFSGALGGGDGGGTAFVLTSLLIIIILRSFGWWRWRWN